VTDAQVDIWRCGEPTRRWVIPWLYIRPGKSGRERNCDRRHGQGHEPDAEDVILRHGRCACRLDLRLQDIYSTCRRSACVGPVDVSKADRRRGLCKVLMRGACVGHIDRSICRCLILDIGSYAKSSDLTGLQFSVIPSRCYCVCG